MELTSLPAASNSKEAKVLGLLILPLEVLCLVIVLVFGIEVLGGFVLAIYLKTCLSKYLPVFVL